MVTPAYAAVSGTLTANQTVANVTAVNDQSATTTTTVANVTAGTNDQTAVTTTTVANVAEVKASRTLTVGALPATTETIAIGTCAVTFVDGAGAGDNSGTAADDLDCTGGATINNYTIANPGVAHTQAEIASALRSLTNVSDAAHGPLIVGGSSSDATFATTNTETSATNVTFTDGTTGDITATTTVTGVIPVAQVNTITIGGTADTGDVFTATLPTVGAVTYTVTGGDTTTDNIATGLNNAIQASTGYAGQAFTSGAATNVITLTARVAGTGFTQTSGAVNRAAVAQVNTINISGTVEAGDVFTATVPTDGAINYTVAGGDTTIADIATGLNAAIQASAGYGTQDFTSGVSGSVITLTATVVGTGFTQTSGTTNRTAVAQVVTFTPASVTAGETFRGTINGTPYDYLAANGNTVQTVVEALAPSMDGDSAVACSEDDTKVTCTASSAGTVFTYAATTFDSTAPSAFTVGSVVTTGGTVVANKWNASNTGVDITVPVANDPTLTGGTIQLQAEADGSFENLGATYTILVGDLGTNKTLSRSDTELEAITGFSEGDNITFRAIITDSNSNTTTSSISATSLDVDQATATFTTARTAAGTITLTFNENVSSSDTSTTAWTVSGATVTAASQPSNSTAMTLTVTGLTGTSETPTVTYVAANGTVVDSAGNEVADGLSTTATDGLAPTLTEVTPVPALTNDNTPDYIFSSTEAGTIAYAGGCSSGDTSAASGNNTKTFSTLSDGTYGSCTIKVTDSSGNQSSALSVSSFTVDATAPNVPSITNVATDNRVNASEKSAIVVTGSAEADSFVTVTISDSTNSISGTQQLSGGGTSYSVTLNGNNATPAGLSDGNLSVNVTSRDAANNTSSAGTAVIPLDTAAPNAPSTPDLDAADDTGTSSTDNITKNTSSLTFSGTAETGSTVELFDGVSSLGTITATGGNWSFDVSLTAGIHSLTAIATDAAGNVSDASSALSITIDTTAPSGTMVINNNAAYTNIPGVALTFSSVSSDVIQMELANSPVGSFQSAISYESPHSYTLPSNGEETYTVRARFTDAAGNVSSSTSDTIIFDSVAPTISEVTLTNLTTSQNNYVKNGDSVRLTATITDTNQGSITTSNPQNIFANLSTLGGGIAVNPTSYNTSTGVATWADLSVSSTAEANVTATVDATDPAGNAATQGSVTTDADNSIPVATSDSATAVKNTALNISASTLLENDTDAGLDTLSVVTPVGSATHGIVSLSGTTVTFTPATDYLGAASFTYTVSDGSLTATGTVNITVNPPVSSGQALLQPTQTVDSSNPQIVVGVTTSDSTVSIPSTVTNATLDLSNLVSASGSNNNVTLTNNITLNTDTSVGNVNVQIPANITISGPSGSWSGVVNAPSVKANNSITVPSESGVSTTTVAVIEVGFGDVALTFNKAVRILIAGKAGKSFAYVRGSVYTDINTFCLADTQANADAQLGDGADCKINSGADAVIWTKHFSKFVAVDKVYPGSSNTSSSNNSACNDSAPGGAPNLISAASGTNTVTLTWSKAKDPVTHYVISYGLTPGNPLYGNPSVGGKDTTSYTVGSLSGGTTYYFRVRAGNGCNGGAYSNELAETPGGGFVSAGPAAGFIPGVLGASTTNQVTTEEKPSSEVQGASTTAQPSINPPQPSEKPSRGLFGIIGGFFRGLFSWFSSLFHK